MKNEIWKIGNLRDISGKLKNANAKELSELADEGWDE